MKSTEQKIIEAKHHLIYLDSIYSRNPSNLEKVKDYWKGVINKLKKIS